MKRLFILTAFIICLSAAAAQGEEKGRFILGGGPAFVLGSGKPDAPPILMYSLEAGISYAFTRHIRLTAGFGGFREVMSLHPYGWTGETANGPLVNLGADFILRPEDKRFRPTASLSTGYRIKIPPDKGDSAFLSGRLGTDISLGNVRINVSITGEITHTLRGAAGIRVRVFL